MPELFDAGRDEHALVLQLRRRRIPIDDIAKHLGVTRQRAWEIYREALAATPVTQHAENLAEEIALADDAVRDLLAIARSHDRSARTSVEAWNSIRGWSEHKSRLLGLEKAQPPSEGTSRLDALRQAKRRA